MRFSGSGKDNQGELKNNGERRLPVQKTQSFKGDRKQVQKWFQRQFSSQKSQNCETSDGVEIVSVVAAATFAAIASHEEGLHNQKKLSEGQQTSFAKSQSKKQDNKGQASMKKLDVGVLKMPERVSEDLKKLEKTGSAAPTIKRTPTFADAYMGSTSLGKGVVEVKPRPPLLTLNTTTEVAFGDKSPDGGTSLAPGSKKAQADKWKKEELAKIASRYEKMKCIIISWEEEKKEKAKLRLIKREGELEAKRARTLQHYRDDLLRIFKIASKAIASTEDKRINEEMKVNEKAKKMGATGKAPATCLCF